MNKEEVRYFPKRRQKGLWQTSFKKRFLSFRALHSAVTAHTPAKAHALLERSR